MRKERNYSLTLIFTLFLNVSEVELIQHSQMELLQSCTFPDEKFSTRYQYLNKPIAESMELEDWTLEYMNSNKCVGQSDKIFAMKLTEDGYLNGDNVFYPPNDFCVNSKNDTAKICQSHQFVLNKCCPENEIWDLEKHHCRKSPNLYRPTLPASLELKGRKSLLPFQILSISGSDNGNYTPPITNSNSTITSPLVCPPGFDLKIYISDSCTSMSPTSFLEELVTAFGVTLYGNNCIHYIHEMPYEICRFQITQTGIRFETANGLFHRKSEMKNLENDKLYCVEGYFNNPLCYYINRTTDNEIIQQRCVQSLNDFLMFCERSLSRSEESPRKAYCLASIWLSTCPLLFSAAVAKFMTSQKNVPAWTLCCYLLSMFFVNINSVILALETRKLGCKVTDFTMKFLYLSTLCWLTSLNFGLWRTFRSNLPKVMPPHYFLYNLLFSFMIPAFLVTLSYFRAQGNTQYCGSMYCALYSHKTIPYYNYPVIFLISLNLGLFIRTSLTIAGLRKETSSVLNKEPNGRRHLESFRLFTKLFLMTGPIWVIRLVLFYLQIKGVYFTWYGVILEGIFSIPEAVFSIMVLIHPEFKKWARQKYPNISKRLGVLGSPSQQSQDRRSSSFPLVVLHGERLSV